MGGFLGDARIGKQAAMAGLKKAADLEQQRELANKQMKTNEKNQNLSMAASGAATGAMIGATFGSIGGPIGMVVGAAAGYLLSEVF